MAISFYDASVGSYVQILGAMTGVLATRVKRISGQMVLTPQTIVETRLTPDMLPFSFRVSFIPWSIIRWERLKEIKRSVFAPPGQKPPHTYAQLQTLVAETLETLKKLAPEDVNKLEADEPRLSDPRHEDAVYGERFSSSFSLPNFYFHATTSYDILRSKGAPLGKRTHGNAAHEGLNGYSQLQREIRRIGSEWIIWLCEGSDNSTLTPILSSARSSEHREMSAARQCDVDAIVVGVTLRTFLIGARARSIRLAPGDWPRCGSWSAARRPTGNAARIPLRCRPESVQIARKAARRARRFRRSRC